jgi:hypothetical protein
MSDIARQHILCLMPPFPMNKTRAEFQESALVPQPGFGRSVPAKLTALNDVSFFRSPESSGWKESTGQQ